MQIFSTIFLTASEGWNEKKQAIYPNGVVITAQTHANTLEVWLKDTALNCGNATLLHTAHLMASEQGDFEASSAHGTNAQTLLHFSILPGHFLKQTRDPS